MRGRTLKTVILSAVGGALVWWIILGAVWGWMSPGSAAEQAEAQAEAAVLEALTPICVAKFQQADEKAQKLEELQQTSSWQREEFVMKQGWATFAGNEQPEADIAEQCAERILATASS